MSARHVRRVPDSPGAGRPSPAEPLAAAGAIPLTAAGRQPLFFFGTLMDADVLSRVIGRPVAQDALLPGWLGGVRRVRGLWVTYPVLVPAPNGNVEGRLWRDADRRDIHRVNHFESGEYRAELRTVIDARGRAYQAWLFAGLDRATMAAGTEPWSLEAWRGAHKEAFLADCDRWMADCAEPA